MRAAVALCKHRTVRLSAGFRLIDLNINSVSAPSIEEREDCRRISWIRKTANAESPNAIRLFLDSSLGRDWTRDEDEQLISPCISQSLLNPGCTILSSNTIPFHW